MLSASFSFSGCVCVCVRRIERGGVSSCERLKVSDTGRVLQRAHTPRLLSGEGGRTEAVDGEGSRRRKKKEHEIIRPSVMFALFLVLQEYQALARA